MTLNIKNNSIKHNNNVDNNNNNIDNNNNINANNCVFAITMRVTSRFCEYNHVFASKITCLRVKCE